MSITALSPTRRPNTATRFSPSKERRLHLIDSPFPGRPLFQWDATRNLTPISLERHRERFPRHTGTRPQRCELPVPEQWATNLAKGIAEIIYGYRPLTQLQRWVLPELYRSLGLSLKNMKLHKPLQRGVRVVAARVCPFSERICETCIILEAYGYRRIISIRIEGYNGRWIATALEII